MVSLFNTVKITLLMRLVFISAFTIFLGVIGLNYYSIGVVHDMNLALQEGPLTRKDEWRSMAAHLYQAERFRQKFLLTLNPEVIEITDDSIGNVESIMGLLENDPAAVDIPALMAQYRQSFESTAQAVTNNVSSRPSWSANGRRWRPSSMRWAMMPWRRR